jgi:chemotaxis protein MotB
VRGQRRKNKEETGGSGDWALSYGDMMTLLLTFFVLIVSFSTTELIKFRQAMGSLRGSMGVMMEEEGSSVVKQDKSTPMSVIDRDVMLMTLQEIEEQVFQMNAQDVVSIEISEESVNFRLDDELLFDLGSATLKPGVQQILGNIAKIIKRFSCNVRVEGHTDNLPIRTPQFPSNWELSSARAISVVRYFVEEQGINPTRMVAVGCGEHHPLVLNTTELNRKKNRRVEISLNWKELTVGMDI